MKKVLSLLVLGVAALFLVSCSNQNNLDGEYYWVRGKNNKELMIKIDGDSGTYDIDGTEYSIIDINHDQKQLIVSANGGKYTVNYSLSKDGALTVNESAFYDSTMKNTYYKKDSKALREALKKVENE